MKKWEIWFAAYSKNYAGTGLLNSEVVAEQAWQAAETVTAERVCVLEQALASTIEMCKRGGFGTGPFERILYRTRQDSPLVASSKITSSTYGAVHPENVTVTAVQEVCEHDWGNFKTRCKKCGKHMLDFAKDVKPSKTNEATAQAARVPDVAKAQCKKCGHTMGQCSCEWRA